MAIVSQIKEGITYYKDDKDPSIRWATDSSGKVIYGTKPQGLSKPGPTRTRTVYREDWAKELAKKTGEADVSAVLPRYITDKSLGYDVKDVQSKVKGRSNIYGQTDWWADPVLKDDFIKRNSWYFEKNPNFDPEDKAQVEDFQKSYNERAKSVGLSSYFDKSKGFDIDKAFGQHTYSVPSLNKLEPTPGVTVSGEKPVPAVSNAIQVNPPAEDTYRSANAPWWLQDVINTAAATGTRLGLKKYLPWAPQVNLVTPRAVYKDPTRELAANAEMVGIGTEGAGVFSGPQAFGSRFSRMQGEGAKTAANILSRYANDNVGIANQFENIRTGIFNKNSMLNADTARKLYDGTVIANQQFDNAKRQANNEIRSAYTNALTNRAMTQTLNTMHPNFQVDPTTGGFLEFYKGSPITPNTQTGDLDTIKSLIADGWSREEALKYLELKSGKNYSKGDVNVYQNPALSSYMQNMQRMSNPAIGYNYGPGYDYEQD